MICIRKTSGGPTDVGLDEAVFNYGRSTYEVEGGWTPLGKEEEVGAHRQDTGGPEDLD